jgi:hypothetical protein
VAFSIESITVPLFGKDYLAERPDYTSVDRLVSELKSTGASDIKISVSLGTLAKYTDSKVDPALDTNPADHEIIGFAQQLKAAGFTLTLHGFANVQNTISGSGFGADRPNPTNAQEWFVHHRQLILDKAKLAEAIGAERFVVFGDEVQHLVLLPELTSGWVSLLDELRTLYTGQLTSTIYLDGTIFPGGNNHVQLIPKSIIDQLDLLGVGLFPDPLTDTNAPTLDQLKAAWHSNAKGVDSLALLKSLADFYRKPVWVSDRTFHSYDGDNVDGGGIFGSAPLVEDQQEQADLFESFLSEMSTLDSSWFKGVSFNNWNRLPDYATGIARFVDSPYGENFQNKLAEDVVRKWFGGQELADSISAVYRFWNKDNGDHFYTTSVEEKNHIQANLSNMVYEGSQWATPEDGSGTIDVFRFYKNDGTHFYTTDVTERDHIIQNLKHCTYEGVAFEAYKSAADVADGGALTLTRFYNPRTGEHHFASSQAEVDGLTQQGWGNNEGPAFVVRTPLASGAAAGAGEWAI